MAARGAANTDGRRGAAADSREAPAAALARLYDLDLADDPGDLDLYLALAARTGGPVLELMTGSGRLAVPLAAAGHVVVGVDSDPAMLARARAAADAAGRATARRVSFVQADATGFQHEDAGRFGLAFVALGSLLLLPDRGAQQRAVETLAAHLAPGGIAAVDVWLADATDLARCDGRLQLEWVRNGDDGRIVTKTMSARHDAAAASVELTAIFDEGRPGEAPARWVRVDRLALLEAATLAEMARAAGLEVETLAGDTDLGPLGPGADRIVLVATRPGPAHG
jgi:SAM-dependent methyltransferase